MKDTTTFINELKRIFDDVDCLTDKKYVGRSFYGTIDKDLRLKATICELGVYEHYSALKAEILRRDEGVIDRNIITFRDVWGDKPTTNPNFRNGISPYLWKDGGELGWYVYHPTEADMKMLSNAIEDLVSVYQEQTFSEEYSTDLDEEDDEEMEM